MIYKNAELYGVTELEKRADKEGFVCLRMPAFVRDTLETGMSELLSRASKTTEIRFVMLGDQVKIKLAKFEKGDRSLHSVFVFYGGIQGAWYRGHSTDLRGYMSGLRRRGRGNGGRACRQASSVGCRKRYYFRSSSPSVREGRRG